MDGVEVWPWWLWALTAMWIAAALLWEPAATALREQVAWITFTVLLAGLVIFVVQTTPSTSEGNAPPSWLMRSSLTALLISAFAAIGLRIDRWEDWVTILALSTAATIFIQLDAPEAAIACGFPAILLLRRQPGESAESTGSPHRWLIGSAALVAVVITLGITRYALIVESGQRNVSRHQTAFPTREWRQRQSSLPAASIPVNPEWCWLAAIVALAALTTHSVAQAERPA